MFAYRRIATRRRVIVNLRSGKAFRGVLWAKSGPLLVLRDAELLEHGRAVAMDGEVVLERANLDFLQVLA